jgi:hypothetical protein
MSQLNMMIWYHIQHDECVIAACQRMAESSAGLELTASAAVGFLAIQCYAKDLCKAL